jgi:outer membrane protein assembly factor BamD
VAVLLVAGCSAKKKPQIPAEDLWSEANEAFDDEAWEYAVERYKLLLEQYPFDPNAEEAELRIARAHYLSGKYPEAIASLGDFERMHPTSPNLPFVEYHLGMSYLAQSSTSDRDPAPHTSALAYFKNVIDRFPTSPWAERARLRLRECQESLARHDAGIAAYYLKRGNLRAAEGRLRGILQDYPGTSAAGDMLYTFAGEYARRDEAEGATLALATLVKYHGDEKVGRRRRRSSARPPRRRTGWSKARTRSGSSSPVSTAWPRTPRGRTCRRPCRRIRRSAARDSGTSVRRRAARPAVH